MNGVRCLNMHISHRCPVVVTHDAADGVGAWEGEIDAGLIGRRQHGAGRRRRPVSKGNAQAVEAGGQLQRVAPAGIGARLEAERLAAHVTPASGVPS